MKAFTAIALSQIIPIANGTTNLQQFLDPKNISFKNKSTWWVSYFMLSSTMDQIYIMTVSSLIVDVSHTLHAFFLRSTSLVHRLQLYAMHQISNRLLIKTSCNHNTVRQRANHCSLSSIEFLLISGDHTMMATNRRRPLSHRTIFPWHLSGEVLGRRCIRWPTMVRHICIL